MADRPHELGIRRMCKDIPHILEALGVEYEVYPRREWLSGYYRIGSIYEAELLNVDDSSIGRVVTQEKEGHYAFYLYRKTVHVDH